jgi:hypothetical protein
MLYLASILVSVFVGLAIILFRSICKIMISKSDLPLTADWIEELSCERYQPMLRLLDGRDLEFLRSQPGYTPEMERALRRQRCQVFRGYLRSLTADFQRVCAAIKLMMLYSGIDRPDLASALTQNQILFAVRLVEVRFAVYLYRYGLCTVNITALVRIFETAQVELRTLVPSDGLAISSPISS